MRGHAGGALDSLSSPRESASATTGEGKRSSEVWERVGEGEGGGGSAHRAVATVNRVGAASSDLWRWGRKEKERS